MLAVNREERIRAGLHPKMGSTSLAEDRRTLMTWTKAELVGFYLREESEALKAIDRAIGAEQALRDHRAEAMTLEKRTVRDTPKSPEQKRAYEEWKHRNQGRGVLADDVFISGWNARPAEPAELRADRDAATADVAKAKASAWDEGIAYSKGEAQRLYDFVVRPLADSPRPTPNALVQPCRDALSALDTGWGYKEYEAHIGSTALHVMMESLVVYPFDDDPNPYRARVNGDDQ